MEEITEEGMGSENLQGGSILNGPRPWKFSRAELTAGLRRRTGDPTLKVIQLDESDIPNLRAGVGRLRGMDVFCEGQTVKYSFQLVLKESQQQGNTRAGTTAAGRRETAFYQNLADQLPVRIPDVYAADATGEWLIMNMLDSGKSQEAWSNSDYLLAIDQLSILHDRFWGLGDDLKIYPWLLRPFDADLEIYIKVIQSGISTLLGQNEAYLLKKWPELGLLMRKLTGYAEDIARELSVAPATLLHGDYWPGNIRVDLKGRLTVFDWQEVSIGPGVVDLLYFIQTSRWWFDPLPVDAAELIAHYRAGILASTGRVWSDQEWLHLWDYALMWVFMVHWIEILTQTPEPIIGLRYQQLEEVWFKPVILCIKKHLPE